MSAPPEKSHLMVAAAGILGDLAKTIFSVEHWHRVLAASVVPFVVSALWNSSRTTIEITDDEQSLWVRMWLLEQKSIVERVRRLVMLSPSSKRVRQRDDEFFFHDETYHKDAKDEEKEDGGGRFAPPKLEFQPNEGVNAWARFGMWPVSVSSFSSDRSEGYNMKHSGGYSITVWLASPTHGTSIARDLLLRGRNLWLEKRAKKTELWTPCPNQIPTYFKITTRASRPLSSVIVGGDTKEKLLLDARRFLDSEKWYVEKGIPYRRGYLLYGPPGCGKTSLIHALAGELRLPIIVVSLNDKEMRDEVFMSALSQAPRDSIILIEDIDCVLPQGEEGDSVQEMMRHQGQMTVTMAGLLNAIDGVGAQEGRLLFMTTNHIDRLDAALIRPGRVDVKCHLDKASKKTAAELFDQVFNPLEETIFSPKLLSEARSNFLSHIQDGAYSFASLQGVLIAARDDPLLVGDGMQQLLSATADHHDDAADLEPQDSPWAIMSAMKKETQDALEEENRNEKAQLASGTPVVKRLIGSPSCGANQNLGKRWISFGCFTTVGAPDMFASSGVIYYEIEIISNYNGKPQFGFSNKDGLPLCNKHSSDGVGDNETSWAVDGSRKRKWHGGSGKEAVWNCEWKEGTIVGLAANVDKGMIAVSKDGVWDKQEGAKKDIDKGKKDVDELGVIFHDEKIKKGVFPSFTASRYKLQYSLAKEQFKHGPPPDSIWSSSAATMKGQ